MNRAATITIVTLAATFLSGCLFDPECETYEACVVSGTGADAGKTLDVEPDSVIERDTSSAPADSGGICLAESCPDSDRFIVGGSRDEPLGCDRFGRSTPFEFSEQAEVCSGDPRHYILTVESCEDSYVVEATVTPVDGCISQEEVTFDFAGRTCDTEGVRCEIREDRVIFAFLVTSDTFGPQRFDLSVDASRGGFLYDVSIELRR